MSISNTEELEELISRPSEGVIETLAKLDGDIIVLGAGGKMGPSLTRMAKRASETAGIKRRVIAVSRFSRPDEAVKLNAAGVETIPCDLLDPDALQALPDIPNVIFMVGMKFGTTGQEALTWAMNAYLPGTICRKYHSSRIEAFSTGNIYGLTPVCLGGPTETAQPNPEGEYAMSALGRERIFEHFSRSLGIPTAIIRLNYAVEMRYGVLVDIAKKVFASEPLDVTMGNANVIWQGDANAMTLQAFGHVSTPPFVLNVVGPEILSIRRVAERFGELMSKSVTVCGEESPDALLSNGQLGHKLFGYPSMSVQAMMESIANWVMSGGESLGKPTHFESRDGKF